jgi:hypothetical protein
MSTQVVRTVPPEYGIQSKNWPDTAQNSPGWHAGPCGASAYFDTVFRQHLTKSLDYEGIVARTVGSFILPASAPVGCIYGGRKTTSESCMRVACILEDRCGGH